MGIEIERKFLVDVAAFNKSCEEANKAVRVSEMIQGYFTSPEALEKASMRVRIEYSDIASLETKSWLNIKSVGTGHTRQEFEYEIPTADALELLKLCVGSVVRKHRLKVIEGGMTWEVDYFRDDNQGLVVAEIELPSADHPFEKPAWVGKEVTDDLAYTNLALSNHPFKDWT